MAFESNSVLVTVLVIFVVGVVPVKLVAGFFGARNATYVSAFLSLLATTAAFYVVSEFTGFGYIGAYLGMAMAVWVIMRPSLVGSILVPAVAVLLMFGVIQGLTNFEFLGFSGN